MPILSIIVPVYNKVDYITECIESILSQTLKDFELIIVNDGSTDGSSAKCDSLAASDERIIVLHKENGGVSSARNVGLLKATGAFIGFVDSDDSLEKDMYEVLIDNAIAHNADISMCGVRRLTSEGSTFLNAQKTKKVYDKLGCLKALLNGEILLSNYEKIYRREVLQGISFYPPLFEDTYFNFEAFMNASVVVYDPTIKYNYMVRPNSHSLAGFNWKYMNTAILSKKMYLTCRERFPSLVQSAAAFDFNSNFFILNLIILSSTKAYQQEYETIRKNLEKYAGTFWNNSEILKRYKYGYKIFKFSPKVYNKVLHAYSVVTGSEHLQRRSRKSMEK